MTQTVTTPKIIDQIHKLILKDCQISAKTTAEQLCISCERVGSIIHEDMDMGSSVKWVPKCLNEDQKCHWYLEFFGTIQMISCHDW